VTVSLADRERLDRLRAALRRKQLPEQAPISELRSAFVAAMARNSLDERAVAEPVRAGQLEALKIASPGCGDGACVVVYLHGGAYVLGSAQTGAPLASRIAVQACCTVLCLDYPLAPEHPHPEAIDRVVDVVAAETAGGARVIVGGDSAGGGLAVAAAVALRDRGERMPAGLFCLSPWVDLTLTLPSVIDNADLDPLAPPELLRRLAGLYVQERAALTLPSASPRFADLAGLPPMLIHASRHEVLRDDALALAETAERAGVKVGLDLWDHVPHAWHTFAPVLPEANEAIDAVAAWITHTVTEQDRAAS
jgi:acetyl esterase/lipase